ncbi:MAG: hypothetical protein SVM86_05610, partial [Candidatus Cloacimonadota bacterium]|nr:hypothetical protein [Candidatus Cloacimonadota bacterium]
MKSEISNFINHLQRVKNNRRKPLLLSIGNGQYCGSGFRLTPNAKVNDGKFNVCFIDPLSRKQIF